MALNFTAAAAPGDTTWVQANIAQLGGYGSYDSTITFPAAGTSYRNVYMVFTLGKYTCPTGSTYCGDWDYTVQNFLMTPGGDTLELGRLITPYANAGAPRTPWAWKQRYTYDVTDYISKLQGSATMRIFYSGYSGGFTANIRFAFVEGTPDRNVTGIERLWNGSFGYGGTPHINAYFPTMTKTAPTGTVSADLKFTITGHGADANGCCEFLSKNYDVILNSSTIATRAIWKACGLNHMYPQSGTWIYDRANWCPGERTYSNIHNLAGVTPGVPYDVDIQFEPYVGGGSYTTEATLINYAGINKTLDAGIDDIISPTNHEDHFRDNPICNKPTIHVKNHGSTAITSIAFEYGIKDSVMETYTWSGSLAALAEADVVLPDLDNLHVIAGTTGTHTFMAKITAVNGGADGDNTNDVLTSQFIPSPLWPAPFKILFRTNNEPVTTGSTVSETKWEIFDIDNNVVASRTSAALSTTYTDTVTLPTGCYRLQITDGSCDGLQWWANSGSGITNGSLIVRKMNNANINMNGYSYSGTYNNDFGCGFSQYFYTSTPTAVTDLTSGSAGIFAYPNPAQKAVTIEIGGIANVSGTIQVVDMMGRVVLQKECSNSHEELNVSQLSNGVYSVLFIGSEGNKLQTKLLIAK